MNFLKMVQSNSHIVVALSLSLILAACGGSGVTAATDTSVVSNGVTTPATTSVPTASLSAISLSSNGAVTLSVTSGSYLLSGNPTSIDLSGSGYTVDITSGTTGSVKSVGLVNIGGSNITVIFRANTSFTNLSLGGTGNTVWIPSSLSTLTMQKSIGNTIYTY